MKRRAFPVAKTVTFAMTTILVASAMLLATPQMAGAFCGFYVAKADAQLFNQASKVVLVRLDDKTVITMSNDYRGDPKEFAMVIPVPTVLGRSQIHVTKQSIIDHLDAYTAPRLVEYFDSDPCFRERDRFSMSSEAPAAVGRTDLKQRKRAEALGVTIEATYTVGEYDILILSAKESGGLERWLTENDYRIPDGASEVLASYIKQGTKFFVAKVNLEEQSKLGFTTLRPLQMAFESPKFMLPIRLGTVNADGPQDLLVYTLTKNGRVETTNYRTVRIPSDEEIPEFVEDQFSDFYRDMFARQVKKEKMRAVFTEYAWDMAWCDPCAADPMSRDDLRELGVFWLDGGGRGAAQNVFVTRLHVRYDAEHFPADLKFQETGDRSNFQGRYVLRHPWTGNSNCPGAAAYREQLRIRQEQRAKTLASLTGWDIGDIRDQMQLAGAPEERSWWDKLWNK